MKVYKVSLQSQTVLFSIISFLTKVQLNHSPQYKMDVDWLEQVWRKALKTTRGLEHLSFEKRLRALGLFSLEKSLLGRD